jgi:glycosyltransferase involved in cell wall biosynthesis
MRSKNSINEQWRRTLKVGYIYHYGHYVNNAFADTITKKEAMFSPFGRYRFLADFPFALRLVYDLFAQFKTPRADVYFLEGGDSLMIGVIRKKLTGARLVLRNGDPLFYICGQPDLPAWKREMLKFLIKNIDGIISDSPLTKELAQKYVNVPNEIGYPFADVDRFQSVKPNLKSHNLMYLGVVNKYKGADILIKAFQIVKEKLPDANLYLCGKRDLIKGLKVDVENKDGVHALGFYKYPEEIMKKCSMYVNAARIEPFGINVIEAMCAGLIPVVSKNVGAKYAVQELDPSLIVEPNPYILAKKIIKVFNTTYHEKLKLSTKAKKIGLKFDKRRSIKNFQSKFWGIAEEIFAGNKSQSR